MSLLDLLRSLASTPVRLYYLTRWMWLDIEHLSSNVAQLTYFTVVVAQMMTSSYEQHSVQTRKDLLHQVFSIGHSALLTKH